jgi:hypothetical protein
MTSLTGTTGIPREEIPAMIVWKSAWEHSVDTVAAPVVIL